MKRTIAILASSRRLGNTGQLLDCLAEKLDIKVMDLSSKQIGPFSYEFANSNDDFVSVMKELVGYERIIFASPVYWYAPSAQMKAFLDRITDLLNVESLKNIGRRLRGIETFIVSTSGNKQAGNIFTDPLVATFQYLSMNYLGHFHACCDQGFSKSKLENELLELTSLLEAD